MTQEHRDVIAHVFEEFPIDTVAVNAPIQWWRSSLYNNALDELKTIKIRGTGRE
jgi:hypothetical protein